MEVKNLINGQLCTADSDRTADVFNPSTGEVITQVALSSDADCDRAVQAASNALQGWKNTPIIDRARIMFRYRDLLEQNFEQISALITTEHGKTLAESRAELKRGIEVVEFACGIPSLFMGQSLSNIATDVDSDVQRHPVGVCLGITPYNFPAMVPMWMYPNALVCGNSFVLKPSERDPSASLFMAELLKQAGLPDGVFNVVQGGKEAVDAILDHPGISAVSFVGSTPIAKYIYTRATSTGKRVQALGGAKNHMVVLPDADMQQVTDALMGSAFGSAGERCMAISVAVPVGDQVADELMERMTPLVKELQVGPPDDKNAAMGALITRDSLNRIEGLIQSGVDQGAELLVDGRGYKVQGYENGFFLGGTLFDKVRPEMEIYKEEVFGPVLSTVRVNDYQEALDLIHNNPYGNGTAIFTRDGDAARDFVSRIEVGMVGVNVPIPVPVAFHSFGGWKQSLFGDHHIYGPETIHFYTRMKAVTSRWPTGIKSGAVYNFPTLN